MNHACRLGLRPHTPSSYQHHRVFIYDELQCWLTKRIGVSASIVGPRSLLSCNLIIQKGNLGNYLKHCSNTKNTVKLKIAFFVSGSLLEPS